MTTDGCRWDMYYQGASKDSGPFDLGYATSVTGTSWVRHSRTPVLTQDSQAWTSNGIVGSSVVKSGGTYLVFYQGSGPVRESIGVASGPETEPIFLDADPELVTQGDQLSFATWQGAPGDLAGLAVTAVNGSPTFHLLLHGKFDACGTWPVNVPVPSGLSGLSVSLKSFALGRFTGYVLGSNTETVIFQ